MSGDTSVFATANRIRDALDPVASRLGLNAYTAITYGAPTVMLARPRGARQTIASVRARYDGQAAVHAPHPEVRDAITSALTAAGLSGRVVKAADEWTDNA